MDHNLIFIILGAIFVAGYALIAMEHSLRLNKSGIAIILGALLWLGVDIYERFNHGVGEALAHETQEIFSIVVFLLSAMTIVEILLHYRFFDWIQEKIVQKRMSSTALWWILGALTFVLSAFLDNLTTTLIMIQIGRKIYRSKDNFLIFTANTIIAANAGGAASPIGDVTTIMLWLAGKFSAGQIISMGTLPAIATWVVPQYLLGRKISKHEEAEKEHPGFDLVDEKKVQPYWAIVFVGLFSFLLPVVFSFISLPPFLGLLTGVGILWIITDIISRRDSADELAKEGKIVNIIQKADLSTLKFFIGILLAVGALSHIGLLKELNLLIFGADLDSARLIVGNILLGGVSSILDNVPLVAAAIKMFAADVPNSIWVLLALTAGTGGSMLVVGSAAGVAAMGQVKELSFGYYLKKASLPAVIGYICGIAVWLLMYLM